jgi:ubiquinone/menaquinone biosynthesis C-methylase UbiE
VRERYKPGLLPKNRLVVTGPVDKAAWNYSPLLAPLQRARFELVHQFIKGRKYDTILEVGYGSGVFLPDLATRCDTLLGVDVHQHSKEVTAALAAEGVSAYLYSASAEALPLESDSVDLIVSISVLEYVSDKAAAAHELHRVLRNGGHLALVQPLAHKWLDAGLRALTGEDSAQYGEGRQQLVPSMLEQFSIVRRTRFPEYLPQALCVYDAVLLEAR